MGGGFAVPAVTAGVMGSAPTALAGIASATLNAGRQVGGVLGVALLGGLATASGHVDTSAMHTALLIAGMALAAASALAFTLPAPDRAPARDLAFATE
jgi:DHA2 family methylenomycin A resistance protein-like MFS transporter